VKALLVKTSSLGDVVHALPAVTDAVRRIPGLRFDWVVEEAFADIPALHPAVARIIPIALRRWRRNWVAALRDGEVDGFLRDLRRERYDLVIDAQGLVKSALPALAARGPAAGLGLRSAREPLASLLYRRRYAVPRALHAIERIRRLFALALHYEPPQGEPDYGFQPIQLSLASRPYVIFLHGTTWGSKHYPETQWIELASLVGEGGYEVRYPWGNAEERWRAERIAAESNCGRLLPRLSLRQLAEKIAGASGVVGVDTGLAHLAAGLGVPAVTLYGPTQAGLTGAVGPHQRNLEAQFPCAPCMRRECRYRGESEVHPACFATLPAAEVWSSLVGAMTARRTRS
jgi:heptosyltransferase-1